MPAGTVLKVEKQILIKVINNNNNNNAFQSLISGIYKLLLHPLWLLLWWKKKDLNKAVDMFVGCSEGIK